MLPLQVFDQRSETREFPGQVLLSHAPVLTIAVSPLCIPQPIVRTVDWYIYLTGHLKCDETSVSYLPSVHQSFEYFQQC